ncbi:hypothetical protein ACFP3Q_14035 [Nocardioides sp. GCM10027113]|uniref:hypothetical protein n=1 Tax=unclassified Nocardioides TaxID=2615069 RepID=UPI00360B0FD7
MRNLRTSLVVALSTAVLVLALAPAAQTAQAAQSAQVDGSLHVTPDDYVGGQALTFTGHIGAPGEQRITLQQHLGRSGDGWADIKGFSAQTDAYGAFEFTYPAPSMFGIKYRVVAGGAAVTPAWTFNAKSQDLTLELDGEARAGREFSLLVDTTPSLWGRPDTIGLLPFPGRVLTLERRGGDNEWEHVDDTIADQEGHGRFDVTVAEPGTVVYRVVQEDWTRDGDQVGWFPSFPTYVEVLDPRAPRTVLPAPSDDSAETTSSGTSSRTGAMAPATANGDVATSTASSVNGWAPSVFDFAWVSGESLTSPPYRGTRLQGWWRDYSDGAGRVGKHNGGLVLDSSRKTKEMLGDFGTTMATLEGNSLKFGRWETRLRLKAHESSHADYRALVELVPADEAARAACGVPGITVADMSAHSGLIRYGAVKAPRSWRGKVSVAEVNNRSIAVAVEVTRKHVSWFVDGRVVGTVGRKAVPRVPLTLRMSLVGNGAQEMNHTQLVSDWQRGFTLKRGDKVGSGSAVKRNRYASSC